MLDTVGILFSTTMLLIIAYRAFKLDKTQPWFQPIKSRSIDTAGSRRWNRRT